MRWSSCSCQLSIAWVFLIQELFSIERGMTIQKLSNHKSLVYDCQIFESGNHILTIFILTGHR